MAVPSGWRPCDAAALCYAHADFWSLPRTSPTLRAWLFSPAPPPKPCGPVSARAGALACGARGCAYPQGALLQQDTSLFLPHAELSPGVVAGHVLTEACLYGDAPRRRALAGRYVESRGAGDLLVVYHDAGGALRIDRRVRVRPGVYLRDAVLAAAPPAGPGLPEPLFIRARAAAFYRRRPGGGADACTSDAGFGAEWAGVYDWCPAPMPGGFLGNVPQSQAPFPAVDEQAWAGPLHGTQCLAATLMFSEVDARDKARLRDDLLVLLARQDAPGAQAVGGSGVGVAGVGVDVAAVDVGVGVVDVDVGVPFHASGAPGAALYTPRKVEPALYGKQSTHHLPPPHLPDHHPRHPHHPPQYPQHPQNPQHPQHPHHPHHPSHQHQQHAHQLPPAVQAHVATGVEPHLPAPSPSQHPRQHHHFHAAHMQHSPGGAPPAEHHFPSVTQGLPHFAGTLAATDVGSTLDAPQALGRHIASMAPRQELSLPPPYAATDAFVGATGAMAARGGERQPHALGVAATAVTGAQMLGSPPARSFPQSPDAFTPQRGVPPPVCLRTQQSSPVASHHALSGATGTAGAEAMSSVTGAGLPGMLAQQPGQPPPHVSPSTPHQWSTTATSFSGPSDFRSQHQQQPHHPHQPHQPHPSQQPRPSQTQVAADRLLNLKLTETPDASLLPAMPPSLPHHVPLLPQPPPGSSPILPAGTVIGATPHSAIGPIAAATSISSASRSTQAARASAGGIAKQQTSTTRGVRGGRRGSPPSPSEIVMRNRISAQKSNEKRRMRIEGWKKDLERLKGTVIPRLEMIQKALRAENQRMRVQLEERSRAL